MNHSLVALLGCPASFAIAIVPRVFEIPGSFWMGGKGRTWVGWAGGGGAGLTVPEKTAALDDESGNGSMNET